jgi:hypothetical protein
VHIGSRTLHHAKIGDVRRLTHWLLSRRLATPRDVDTFDRLGATLIRLSGRTYVSRETSSPRRRPIMRGEATAHPAAHPRARNPAK